MRTETKFTAADLAGMLPEPADRPPRTFTTEELCDVMREAGRASSLRHIMKWLHQEVAAGSIRLVQYSAVSLTGKRFTRTAYQLTETGRTKHVPGRKSRPRPQRER